MKHIYIQTRWAAWAAAPTQQHFCYNLLDSSLYSFSSLWIISVESKISSLAPFRMNISFIHDNYSSADIS